MNTELVKVTRDFPEDAIVARAAEILRTGGLVAFPTETVYGLGADALNVTAVEKIFRAKGRPADNPLIIHIATIEQLYELGRGIPAAVEKLAAAFWPGPLTVVVRRQAFVPDIVTAGLDTVAVRMPRHPVTLALIKKLSSGIVGPSANLSGKPSPTTAEHVYDDLKGSIDLILDAGPTEIGVESTVVDVTTVPPTILRFGGLIRERIEQIVGTVQSTSEDMAWRRSPGTRHRHYAPRARVVLVKAGGHAELSAALSRYQREGMKVGCIIHSHQLSIRDIGKLSVLLSSNIDEFARLLFDTMRKLDELGVDVILVEEVPEIGLGVAVMDRLRRATAADATR